MERPAFNDGPSADAEEYLEGMGTHQCRSWLSAKQPAMRCPTRCTVAPATRRRSGGPGRRCGSLTFCRNGALGGRFSGCSSGPRQVAWRGSWGYGFTGWNVGNLVHGLVQLQGGWAAMCGHGAHDEVYGEIKDGFALDSVPTLDCVASGVALHGPFCSSSDAETPGVDNEFLPGRHNAIRYPGMTTTLGLLLRYSADGRQFWNRWRRYHARGRQRTA